LPLQGWLVYRRHRFAAITLFVTRHPRRRRHRKADCCIIVTVASWIEVVVIIASPPSRTYQLL
jgi:hypothetical protein